MPSATGNRHWRIWRILSGPAWWQRFMVAEIVIVGFGVSMLLTLLESAVHLLTGTTTIQISIWAADASLVGLAIPLFALAAQMVHRSGESGLPETEAFYAESHLSETLLLAVSLFIVIGLGVVLFHGVAVTTLDFITLIVTLILGAGLYSNLLIALRDPDQFHKRALVMVETGFEAAAFFVAEPEPPQEIPQSVTRAMRWHEEMQQHTEGLAANRRGTEFAKYLGYYEALSQAVSPLVDLQKLTRVPALGWFRKDYQVLMEEALAAEAGRSAHQVVMSARRMLVAAIKVDEKARAREMASLLLDLWRKTLTADTRERTAVLPGLLSATRTWASRLTVDNATLGWERCTYSDWVGLLLRFTAEARDIDSFEKIYDVVQNSLWLDWPYAGMPEYAPGYLLNERFTGAMIYAMEALLMHLRRRDPIRKENYLQMRSILRAKRVPDTWEALTALCDEAFKKEIMLDLWDMPGAEAGVWSSAIEADAKRCALFSYVEGRIHTLPDALPTLVQNCVRQYGTHAELRAVAGSSFQWNTPLVASRLKRLSGV